MNVLVRENSTAAGRQFGGFQDIEGLLYFEVLEELMKVEGYHL